MTKHFPVIPETSKSSGDSDRSGGSAAAAATTVVNVNKYKSAPQIESGMDVVWENLKSISLKTKYEQLDGPGLEEAVQKVPEDAHFIQMSEKYQEDIIVKAGPEDPLTVVNDPLRLNGFDVSSETAEVHVCQLTCIIDETKNCGDMSQFASMVQTGCPVGVFGHGATRAEALKKAINLLHYHYVEKQRQKPEDD